MPTRFTGNMPAIQTKAGIGFVGAIGSDHLVKAGICSGKFPVLTSHIEIVGTTEIIFCSRSADGGKLLVPIHKEFYLTFAPPSIVIHLPCQKGAHILALTCNAIHNGIGLFVFIGIRSSELGMKVSRIIRNISEHIIYLIIQAGSSHINVLHGNPAFFLEGHLPVAVKGPSRIYTNSQ